MDRKTFVRSIDFIKKNKFVLGVVSVVFLTFIVCYSDILIKLGLNETFSDKTKTFIKVAYSVGFIALSCIIVFILRLISKRNIKYENIFLILASFLGVVFLIMSPLFTGSDEINHYYRIYELTEGVFVTPTGDNYSGGDLPLSLSTTFLNGGGAAEKIKYPSIPSMAGVPLEKENVVTYGKQEETFYANTSLYSPLTYIPHIVGFSIGKCFNAGPYIIGMLGRLSNLIFYLVIGYFAIKIMPRWKLFFLLIFISPNMMQLASTLSADAFMYSLLLLFVAYILNIRANLIMMNSKKMILLLILSILLALCKTVYVPFVALSLLIPNSQFRSGKKGKILFSSAVIIFAIVCNLIWISKTDPIFSAVYMNHAEQKDFIISSPLYYLVVLARTCINSIVKVVEDLFVGTRMYNSQLLIPTIFSFFYVGLVVYSLFLKEDTKKDIKFSSFERLVVVIICLVVPVLILTALYVQVTASGHGVGNPTVAGIQGRYFIPIVICLPLLVKAKKRRNIKMERMIGLAMASSLVVWFYMFNIFII